MKTYICVFLSAALAAFIVTPVVILLGRYLQVLDRPGLRKVHAAPVPRLGGVAIACPVLAVIAAVFLLGNAIGQEFRIVHPRVLALLAGAVFMLLVGLIDDIRIYNRAVAP